MSNPSGEVPRAIRSVRGTALVAVLYFLVLAALSSIAVLFGTRVALRHGGDRRSDAGLIAAADRVLYGALARWNGPERVRQPIGSTIQYRAASDGGIDATLWITRLQLRIFSLVAEVREHERGAARRITLLVRVPLSAPRLTTALLSAVDVSIGEAVRLVAVDSGACADTAAAALTLAPAATLTLDPALPVDRRPSVRVDTSAADSLVYLRVNESMWEDLVRGADVRLAPDAHVTPGPVVSDGACTAGGSNWGEPGDAASPCSSRAPLVYAPGDLVIDGGRGQGVLLVDGRLLIAGPFTYSGQIVVRRGLETRADAISISGVVYAWRATSDSTRSRADRADVVLTHGTSLRYSRCDAAHGMASWLQPRAVRARAWTELF